MTDGQQVAVMVRERARGVTPDRDDGLLVHLDAEAYAARRRELLGWPLDFVMVEQLRSGELTVRVVSTAPRSPSVWAPVIGWRHIATR